MSTLQVAGFLDHSTVNGEGFRSVLFLSGCPHACPGCHNPEMQAFHYGDSVEASDILQRILKNKPLIDGITFSGGEPFEQTEALIDLAASIKSTGLTLWCYTGYTYEQLITNPSRRKLLNFIDVLIDGPFILAEKDEHLLYRGSRNQRILYLSQGKIIES
ncbi:anaerobic ribonucleoside-triphosphate reductase activating protein [Cellulosilyticum sp. ST5]|uniref:anaerobic ribonucleoside-triphosphate reductase activating protein n=1 Tax=unclassified Cellulosilyticum TaxID=2643091 RepID=UPI000F8F46C7|nr:anaerobic ribonucleoside-triphosphate reductase activating protein [Cellulosilyticum sp. WCF-2]QEH68876.1 anaerobic ribonucleoside-triphosphate reductase activating protein [Cellulosilyticum sp. WCF-2]